MSHKLKLLPIEGQHPLFYSPIKAMYCEECNLWYYKDKDGNYPEKCINDCFFKDKLD